MKDIKWLTIEEHRLQEARNKEMEKGFQDYLRNPIHTQVADNTSLIERNYQGLFSQLMEFRDKKQELGEIFNPATGEWELPKPKYIWI